MSDHVRMVLLGVLMADWLLYALLSKGIDEAFYKAHINITNTGDVLRSPLILTTLAVIIASITAVLAFTLINSWRMNNRLRCLSEGIEGLRNGDLTIQIEGCRGGQFIELVDTFNKSVRQLNRKMTYIKDDINHMEEDAAGIKPDSTDAIEQLLKRIDSIETHLSTFKLRQ